MAQEPTQIGRYQVQRTLGQGAMGVVYLALDPLLKRLVAVKVVHALGEDAAATLARFQREAEISAKLNHPNIVTVYDVGQDPAVGPFLAMEYIDGTSLSKLIRIGITAEAGMRLLVQGMGALQAAEAQGIVHRDIKPDNILVSSDGRFKLMDFGIARRDESHLTQAGMIFGTPSYTAPELLVGGDATPATDRYAFAVTAFEIVTGKLPYSGSSVGSTLYRIVHEPPTMAPDMKPYLAGVFQKALAKDPRERFGNLPEFMTALVEALDFSEETKLKLLAFIQGDHPYIATQPMTHEMQLPPIHTEALLVPPQPTQDGETRALSHASLEAPAFEPQATQASPKPVVLQDEPIEAMTFIPPPRTPEATPEITPAPAPPQPAAPRSVPSPTPTRSKAIWTSKPLLIGAVAVLVIGGGAALFALRPKAPTTLTLAVVTAPAGANVSVDGRLVGTAPAETKIGADAKPMVEVQLAGYVPQSRMLAKGTTRAEFTLIPSTDTLRVVTDPEGADVLLDGQPMGKTPLQAMPLPASGMPRLVLRLEGFEEWSTTLDKDSLFPEVITLTPIRSKRKR